MTEWALKYPEGFILLAFAGIAGITIIGIAFALAWAHRKRDIDA